jgi:subtilisin family serine protease
MAYKACWELSAHDDAAVCNSFTLAQGLAAAIEAQADVINLSLSGPADPLLAALLGQAIARRIAVVGAMDPAGDRTAFPAGIAGVIAVDTAEQSAGPGSALRSPQFGVRAPGLEILTLVPGGGYDFASGSSLAAAHATGVAALLLSKQPPLTPGQVGELLRRSMAVVDAANAHADSINACAALTALMSRSACPRSEELSVAER